MKQFPSRIFRKWLPTVLLASAMLYAGGGFSAHAFITDGRTVTTFKSSGKNITSTVVTVEYTTYEVSALPSASIDNKTASGCPNMCDTGTAGSDTTFFAPMLDLAKKEWSIGIIYTNAGAIDSIQSLTFAVGTYALSGSSANWISSDTSLGTNVTFTATITAGSSSTPLGTMSGKLFESEVATDWVGSGSEKIIVTLTSAATIDLSAYDSYDITITASLDSKASVKSLGVGFGSVTYETESESEKEVGSFIWRGTAVSHSWNGDSENWNHHSTSGKIEENKTFQLGYDAIFDGKDANHEVLFDSQAGITASHIRIETGAYTFNMQNGAAPTAHILKLESKDARLNLTGDGKTLSVNRVEGVGTLGKTGAGKTTLRAAQPEEEDGSGAMTGFTGNIVVDGGILEIQAATAMRIKELLLNDGTLETNAVAAGGTPTVTITGKLQGGADGTEGIGTFILANGAMLNASAAEGEGGINLTGSMTINYGALLSTEDLESFSPAEPGLTYDLLTVSGDLKFTTAGGQTVTAVDLGDNFDAADVFSNLAPGSYYLSYSVGAGENVGTLYLVSNVPEPSTGTLSLLSLAGLCARRRRK